MDNEGLDDYLSIGEKARESGVSVATSRRFAEIKKKVE